MRIRLLKLKNYIFKMVRKGTNILIVADDDGKNDAIDCYSFTEDDAHKVLGADARSLHSSSQDA